MGGIIEANRFKGGGDHDRGVSGGWAIAHPDLGRLEGTAGQRRRAALLLAHPDFGSYLRPCMIMSNIKFVQSGSKLTDKNGVA